MNATPTAAELTDLTARVATEAKVDRRSARSYLEGKKVKPVMLAAIEDALRRIDRSDLVRSKPAAEPEPVFESFSVSPSAAQADVHLQLPATEVAYREADQKLAAIRKLTPPDRGRQLLALYLVLNGLSQCDIARTIKISRAAVSRWSIGDTRPSIASAEAIQKLTKGFVSVSDWYTDEEIRLMQVRDQWIREQRPQKRRSAT